MNALLLLAGLAFGKEDWLHPAGSECGQGQPILGTSGYSNAIAALRTNTNTYSAGAFAEKHLFAQVMTGEDVTANARFATEIHISHGVTQVPTYQDWTGGSISDCPPDYVTAVRPLDLQAEQLGFGFRAGRFGGFYSASVTFGAVPEAHNYVRFLTWDLGYPAYAMMLLAVAPLTGQWEGQSGASAIALDWIGGMTFDAGVADVAAGYAGSKGFYGNVRERKVGLFGSAALAGLSQVSSYKGGVDRLDGGKRAAGTVGMTSVFARGVPLSEPEEDADEELTLREKIALLQTGHIQQDSIAGLVDVAAAMSWTPEVALHEGALGIHTRGYHLRRQEPLAGAANQEMGFLLRAGVVELPDLYYYGIAGGRFFQARAEGSVTMRMDSDGAMRTSFGVQYNDPEQLVLYPFAVDSLAVNIGVEGAF